jgi:hypothetical protein
VGELTQPTARAPEPWRFLNGHDIGLFGTQHRTQSGGIHLQGLEVIRHDAQ